MVNQKQIDEYLAKRNSVNLMDMQIYFQLEWQEAVELLLKLQKEGKVAFVDDPKVADYPVVSQIDPADMTYLQPDYDQYVDTLNAYLRNRSEYDGLQCVECLVAHSYVRYLLRLESNGLVRYGACSLLNRRKNDLICNVFTPLMGPIRIYYGRTFVIVNVKRYEREAVVLKKYARRVPKLGFVVGEDANRKPIRMSFLGTASPNIFVSGSSGSGKTVFLKSTIKQLIKRTEPSVLRLMVIDTKRADRYDALLNGDPHMRCPVIHDEKEAMAALETALEWIRSNKKILADKGVESIRDLPMEKNEMIPCLLLCIDELAELVWNKEDTSFNDLLLKIYEDGWRYGVFVIATSQRPDACDSIAEITNNRICFAQSDWHRMPLRISCAQVDSLNGKGDGVFMRKNKRSAARFQGLI